MTTENFAATKRSQQIVLIAVMCFSQLLATSSLGAYPALLPYLKRTWSLSSAEAGLVGGTVFLAYAIATPFLTGFTDRMDARRVYLVSVLVAAAGAGYFGLFADGFLAAMTAQALIGVGFAGMYMPGLKALADRVPDDIRPRATGLYSILIGAGMALAFALSGVIRDSLGWRWVFGMVAANQLLAGLLVLTIVRPRKPPVIAARIGLMEAFRRTAANRPALGCVIAYTAHCWEIHGFRSWMVAFLSFSVATSGSVGTDGGVIAAGIALVSLFGNVLFNEISERIGRIRYLLVVMSATPLVAILASQCWRISTVFAVAAACGYYLFANSDAGVLNATVIESTPAAERGSTLAVYSTAGYVGGFLGPAVAGVVLDIFGGTASGVAWTAAFVVLGAPGLFGLLALRRFAGAGATGFEAASLTPDSMAVTAGKGRG